MEDGRRCRCVGRVFGQTRGQGRSDWQAGAGGAGWGGRRFDPPGTLLADIGAEYKRAAFERGARAGGGGAYLRAMAGVEMVGDGPCRRVVAGVLRGVDLRPAEQISSIFKKGFCLDPRCTIHGDHSGLLHTPVHARNTSPGTADTRATSTVQLGS